MSPIIEVDKLTFAYVPSSCVLRDLCFEVPAGTFLAVVGPNGAGKTTLLNLLCGTLSPAKGTITIAGASLQSYRPATLARKVAVVRQEFVPVFGFSVVETVLTARTGYMGLAGFESKADRDAVYAALELTDTARFASRTLGSLSGGERQRVFIARAIAQDTPVLLLDEPTNFLDLKHQVGIYELLKTAQTQKGKTLVAVTHDINLAAQYCDRVLLLGCDGRFWHGAPGDVLTAERIESVFGVPVLVGRIAEQAFFIPRGRFTSIPKPPPAAPEAAQGK